jgi:cytochrome c oxidase subunit 2
MTSRPEADPRRILIVSSHPLFGEGLRSLLRERRPEVETIGLATSTDEALAALDRLAPDLVIVDHDDEAVNREEFLARFVEGERAMRVMLVSLKEADRAVVYDRRTLTASQVEDWLGGPAPRARHAPASTPQPSRRVEMKHFAIVGVLVIIVTVAVNAGLNAVGLMPVEASAQAKVIDRLFNLHITIISFLFSLIVVFLLYSVVVFRRKPGDTSDGDHLEGHTGLEIAWTLAPLATVLLFAGLGAQALADTRRPEPNAFVVKVIARQWSWSFEYPDSGVTSTSLNLPANRQVVLQLTSEDVIHSFWVPEFRVKQDALPGDKLVKELRVTPSRIGDYKVRCAELCGRQHAYMESPVVVMSAADFDAWIAKESAISADPVERGKKWAAQFGCTACHSVDGTKVVGPTWKGLYGSQAPLADGTTAAADDAYLRESIVDANAKIVQGFSPGIMPQTFGATLTEQQISDLIEYIKTLK